MSVQSWRSEERQDRRDKGSDRDIASGCEWPPERLKYHRSVNLLVEMISLLASSHIGVLCHLRIHDR